MSIINNGLLLASEAAAAGGYQVSRSLRFNSSDSAFCGRVPASAGNRTTWTFSTWIKRSKLGVLQRFFTGATATNDNDWTAILFNASDQLVIGGYSTFFRTSNSVYRDCSAWYHLVVLADLGNGTNSLKLRAWINNEEVAWSSTSSNPTTTGINAANNHAIGAEQGPNNGGVGSYFDGYLAEIHFIDGQALTPSSFTEVSATTGQLIPKAYTGSYGTNGFRLTFSDNSGTTSTTLGKDAAGSNNWTPNNFSVASGSGNDSLVDTPTSFGTDAQNGGEVRGNYCTWNPLDNGGVTLANGNLDISNGSSHKAVRGTIKFPATGKWYAEFLLSTFTSGVNACAFGIDYSGATTPSAWGSSGHIYLGGNSTTLIGDINGVQTAISTTSIVGSIFQIAYDADTQNVWVGRNNTWYNSTWGTTGNPATGANPTASSISGGFPAVTTYETSGSANFGQRAFAYTAPSGFKALCDTNLPTPVVAKPNTVMDVVLYSGTGSNQTITGLNFNPDFVWLKRRSSAQAHYLYDVIRGTSSVLYSDGTDAEQAISTGLTAFNSNGFSLGSLSGVNASSTTNVAWAWDAGTSTVTNTQGSITSSVRANASAGFSVVTWTSDGASSVQTMGTGLGVAPGLIIAKNRSISGNWWVWHSSFSNQVRDYLLLQTTDAKVTAGVDVWSTSSTTFGIRQATIANSTNLCVAYCFAPVAGYSSFGTFSPTGTSDSSFVFCGFRPRFLMVKQTSNTSNWITWDTARDSYNYASKELYPNLSDAEVVNSSTYSLDILSNGFKMRNPGMGAGSTWIYCAWAEAPFQYARAR